MTDSTQCDYITFIVIKKLCSSVKERTFKGRGVQPHPFVDPCDSRRREPAAETIWEPHFSNLYRYWLVFSQMPISILQAKLDENNSFFTCGFTCVPFFLGETCWEKLSAQVRNAVISGTVALILSAISSAIGAL